MGEGVGWVGAGWGVGVWGVGLGRGGRCTVGVVQVSKHDRNPIFILACSSDCNLTLTLSVTLNLILTQMNCATTDQQEFAKELFFTGKMFVWILFFLPVDFQWTASSKYLFLMSKSV